MDRHDLCDYVKMFSRKTRGSKKKIFLGLICILLIGSAGAYAYLQPIREVQCTLDANPCDEIIQLELEQSLGNPYRSSKLSDSFSKIEHVFPHIRFVSKQISLFGVLEIAYETNRNAFYIQTDSGQIALIDAEGNLKNLESAEKSPEIVVIKLSDAIPKEKNELNRVANIMHTLMTTLYRPNLFPAEIRIISFDELHFSYRDLQWIASEDQFETQLLTLQEILKADTMELTHKAIDLRFQRPVVRGQ